MNKLTRLKNWISWIFDGIPECFNSKCKSRENLEETTIYYNTVLEHSLLPVTKSKNVLLCEKCKNELEMEK